MIAGVTNNTNRSEKELALFGAIDRLINQGRQLQTLTVSDIAAEAGIGKGTTYEYFPSKEAIIREAIRYHVQNEFGRFSGLIARMTTFHDTFLEGLDLISEMTQNRLPNLWAMFFSLEIRGLNMREKEDMPVFLAMKGQIEALLDTLLRQGQQEGIVDPDLPATYLRFVLKGVVNAYVQNAEQPIRAFMDRSGSQARPDRDDCKAYAWTMLTRALSPGTRITGTGWPDTP